MKNMKISEFYGNQDIFITGGLGFLGKVLIEKLLRCCPDINKIYVLIRAKRNKTAAERLEDIKQLSLFDKVKEMDVKLLEKLIPILGDVAEDNLGIAKSHFKEMKNVSVIFHSAATVRFDESMKDSILINTKGTYEVCKFADQLENLKVMVHLSTTYCNLDQAVLEEKIYPAYSDWRYIIQCATDSKEHVLNEFLEKYTQYKHNTYTLSKHLSEHVINDYKGKIPVVIFRPAIVIPSVSDPMPGWIDNFNGPVGLLTAVGTGVVRTIHADPDLVLEIVPVDVAVTVMLVAGYKKGIELKIDNEESILPIYNCSVPANVRVLNQYGIDLLKDNPFERTLWAPDETVTNSKIYFMVRFFLWQLIPAIIIDTFLRLIRAKPFMVKLQKRAYNGNEAIYNFLSTHWEFKTENTHALEEIVPAEERDKFSYVHLKDCDQKEYLRNALNGAKKFLFKEPVQCTKKALIRFKLMVGIDKLIRFFIYGLILYLLY